MSGTQTITGNYLSPHGTPPDPVFDYGFDLCYSNSGYPMFNLTLNKIEIIYNETSFYFYIDYRDCEYSNGVDVTIRYVKNDGIYYHSFLNVSTSYDDFTKINNGEVLRISEINSYPNTSTYCMNQLSFWQNCLVVIPTANNNPRLVWGPHPSISVGNYVIYRAVSSTPLSNPESSANLIATVSPSTFEYTDNSILLGPVDYVYYFVKGKYRQGYLLTSRSNIVDTRGGLYKENLNEEINTPDKLEITNYPNPFNPSTTINYAIPENGFTELKVYNIYGQLIEALVSGNKEAGSYSAKFPSNGRELASGVYLYTLTSSIYNTTGKMTLIK